MGISSALDRWDDWKLRILVLGSTAIQLFLFIYGGVRWHRIPLWFRLCIWLAYLGGDSLAIYALATLFNRHKQDAPAGLALEVLWAPILLIHLAGQDLMASYSIQDNYLWRRQVITLVSQVTVAMYAFCLAWSGEKILLKAAVLLFIVGILKFCAKPWALKRASMSSIARLTPSVPRRKKLIGSSGGRWTECWRSWTMGSARTVTGLMVNAERASKASKEHGGQQQPSEEAKAVEQGERRESRQFQENLTSSTIELVQQNPEEQEEEEAEERRAELTLNQYVQEARDILKAAFQGPSSGKRWGRSLPQPELFMADAFVTYFDRLKILKFLMAININPIVVVVGLFDVYIRLYTRARVTSTPIVSFLRLLSISLVMAATGLFLRSHKGIYNKHDITVTYILFFTTTLLELLSCTTVACLYIPIPIWPASSKRNQMVYQQSVMWCAARTRNPPYLLKLASIISCDNLLNQKWYIKETIALGQVVEAVMHHVINNGWLNYIESATRYRKFSDTRGQLAMKRFLLCLGSIEDLGPMMLTMSKYQREVHNSLNLPFDESVLLWHVATEIWFQHRINGRETNNTSSNDPFIGLRISRYMMYLFTSRPEMLMTGTRWQLFTVACDDLTFMARHGDIDRHGDIEAQAARLARGIFLTAPHRWVYGNCVGPLIPKACELADALIFMEQRNHSALHQMVQGVWVEMLCYAASHCGGYFHAMSLGTGIEMLTVVWFLQCYLGMETLVDRLHRPVPEDDDEEEKPR